MVHTKVTAISLEKHLQQVRETHAMLFLTERVVGKLLCIQPLIRA